MSGAEPFGFEGETPEIGVLLVHGFTGTPQSMRPWGEALAPRGWTVICPRLPGHGTSIDDLARTTPDDWVEEAESTLVGLAEHCSTVFVAGLSMGGTIALELAVRRPDSIHGLIVVNGSVFSNDPRARFAGMLGRLPFAVKGIGSDIADPAGKELCYARVPLRSAAQLLAFQNRVRTRLAEVRAPLLLFGSRQDHVVPPANTPYIAEHVGSSEVETVWLERSYHVATLDYDSDVIFDRSAAFMAARVPA